MPLSGVTSGLLSAWLVGPLYAHAFIYLNDLIRAFGSDGSAHAGGVNGYFIDNGRFNIIVTLILYVFNVLLNIGVLETHPELGTVGVAISHFSKRLTLQDPTTRALAVTAWALSVTLQISGALLIAWVTLKTPKVVGDDTGARTSKRIPATLFYACVESGIPGLVSEIITVGLVNNELSVMLLAAILGQITSQVPHILADDAKSQAFSSFAIVLRELQKADIDYAKGFVNATSALAMHDLPRIRGRRSMNSLESISGPGNTVMVAIETSRHEDGSMMKPKSFH
ncbi:hypothetical protein PENSPDRAFT_732669 [Peniophora sp. CONT]|nr:hypothetical protein PENSPDRAFT_732669 [Peniophora sp. CONT]